MGRIEQTLGHRNNFSRLLMLNQCLQHIEKKPVAAVVRSLIEACGPLLPTIRLRSRRSEISIDLREPRLLGWGQFAGEPTQRQTFTRAERRLTQTVYPLGSRKQTSFADHAKSWPLRPA